MVIAYSLMGLGGFGMVILLGRTGFESGRLDDFKGSANGLAVLALGLMPGFLVAMCVTAFMASGCGRLRGPQSL